MPVPKEYEELFSIMIGTMVRELIEQDPERLGASEVTAIVSDAVRSATRKAAATHLNSYMSTTDGLLLGREARVISDE